MYLFIFFMVFTSYLVPLDYIVMDNLKGKVNQNIQLVKVTKLKQLPLVNDKQLPSFPTFVRSL